MQVYYNTERRKGKHLTNEYGPDKAQELYRENQRKKLKFKNLDLKCQNSRIATIDFY